MSVIKTELEYYSKNINLDNIGLNGQNILNNTKVLVIGAGGLGCPALLYLTTMGIGNIGIVDYDIVSISNLHRQILYEYSDIGKSKAKSAMLRLKKINPFIKINYYEEMVTGKNIDNLINNYDIILDVPDNYKTRYIIEKACTRQNKIVIHGSVYGYQGQVAVFTSETACYNCAFPKNNNHNESNYLENKIFAPITGFIGILLATEVIKVSLEIGRPICNQILYYNLLDNSIKKIKIFKDDNCEVCRTRENNNTHLKRKDYNYEN